MSLSLLFQAPLSLQTSDAGYNKRLLIFMLRVVGFHLSKMVFSL